MSHKKWYLIASAVVAVTIFTAAVVLVRKISGGDATFARVAAVCAKTLHRKGPSHNATSPYIHSEHGGNPIQQCRG